MSNKKSLAEMRDLLQDVLNPIRHTSDPASPSISADWIINELAERGIVLTSDPCMVKHPDQPCFVLIAQDPLAHAMVDDWARRRVVQVYDELGEVVGNESAKIFEAQVLAGQMRTWRLEHVASKPTV